MYGCTTNSYVRASALGSQFRPPLEPELAKALLGLSRELTAQGNNLNQNTRQLIAGLHLPGQGRMLDALVASMQATYGEIRQALARGRAEPDG